MMGDSVLRVAVKMATTNHSAQNSYELLHPAIDAMLAIDRKQRVIFWNAACEKLTGISASQAVGSLCHELLHGEDPNGRAICMANCPLAQLASGGPPPMNFSLRITPCNNKRKIQLNVSTLLMPSPCGDNWMVVHMLRRGLRNSPAALFDRELSHPDEQTHLPLKAVTGKDFSDNNLCQLSEREREILRLVAQGVTTSGISNQLHISVTTVRNHVQRLMAKLNVHSRIEAVNCAHRNHLV
jgi:DNA-binding CsgD family transcriptional regulator